MHQKPLRHRVISLCVGASLALAIPAAAAAPGQYLHVRVDLQGKVLAKLPRQAVSTTVYWNDQTDFNFPYVSQNGQEWAEDIVPVTGGELTGFGAGFAGFAGAEGDSFDVTYTLYEDGGAGDLNAAGAGGPGAVLLGPWTFRVPHDVIGLGVGFSPFGIMVGSRLWFGVSFSDPDVGLQLHDPPQVGSSDDRYWNRTLGIQQDFGGNPVANFVMSVSVDLPLPVRSTTWSGIKSLY